MTRETMEAINKSVIGFISAYSACKDSDPQHATDSMCDRILGMLTGMYYVDAIDTEEFLELERNEITIYDMLLNEI